MNEPQYTGSQRLVMLYRHLAQGFSVSPAQYAAEHGIKRQSVYYQLKLLKSMGFPIINTEYGEWSIGEWHDVTLDFLSMTWGNTHRTAAQRLVTLYQDLVRGNDISPTSYARSNGIKRQTVYRQFDLLSQAGIPVTNIGNKGWTLMDYVEYLYD